MRRLLLVMMLMLGAPVTAQDALQGASLYRFHCATCHGVAAMGNGPMAPSLVVQPVDLTALKARNGGVFPTTRVVMRIDGSDPLISHGSAMPVYGDFFAGTDVATKAETGQPIMTSQPIVDLLAYLRTLQQE
ncbi:c-type cytochrome [Loktanella agnita]|uniref:c-type cytochrome n=1 Tax=Loktanella agnita TaxID=287097 RepID=UPI003986DE6C